jgi:predicted DNA-binding protein (MmcQ/YjbR family)
MLNAEDIRSYVIRKKFVEESLPFGPETLVYKVHNKIFLLLSLDASPLQFNVKCDPEHAIQLREKYDFVQPGYHMNKKHWNTVICRDGCSSRLVFEWIDSSYELVWKGLPSKIRQNTGS